MKKSFLVLTFFVLLVISKSTFAQDWLPQPVKSPYLDALSGTWVSEPHDFMGHTNTDEVTCKMILNGQYMEVDVTSTDGKGFTYEGKEIISAGADGSLTGSVYDIFGKNTMVNYTLSMDGNKYIINSTGGKGTRETIIDGDNMIQNVTFTMGDRTPEQKMTINYKRQNK